MNITSTKTFSLTKLRNNVWHFGILYGMFNVTNQSFEFLADGDLSAIELFRLFAVSLLLAGWVYLKPEVSLEFESLSAADISTLKYYKLESIEPPHEAYLHKAEIRMLQLAKYHLISQEYVLPIPYLCQIYHLLNLKHLESIHSLSLNGLKIVKVSQFETTTIGGAIRFQTILNSPLNLLRIWRQPAVEVELILHTPYTIELSIPIYNGKNITVIFNVLPLSQNNHKLFIDIYCNVVFPKPLLQVLLHLASGLTLLEDLPYLRKLSEGKIHRSGKVGKGSYPETMQLFERFADLYGSSLEQPQSAGATELRPA
ncbi:MAG: hypothetical protein HC827_08000 [Cyanobacteria bacterium RM1_2_2]|nr:hypothetical protein [Cyanobacteria bacterium RM1_2_2]